MTHQTLSLLLPLSPLEAPPALGAGGMPVPCAFAVELGTAVVPSVLRTEVSTMTTLDASEADVCADGAGFCDADILDTIDEAAEARLLLVLETAEEAGASVVAVEIVVCEGDGETGAVWLAGAVDSAKDIIDEKVPVNTVDGLGKTAGTAPDPEIEANSELEGGAIGVTLDTARDGGEIGMMDELVGKGTVTTTVFEGGGNELGKLFDDAIGCG